MLLDTVGNLCTNALVVCLVLKGWHCTASCMSSLAGEEWPYRCKLYCDGRSVQAVLPDRTIRPVRGCSTASWWHFKLLLCSKCGEPTVMIKTLHGRQGRGRPSLSSLFVPVAAENWKDSSWGHGCQVVPGGQLPGNPGQDQAGQRVGDHHHQQGRCPALHPAVFNHW